MYFDRQFNNCVYKIPSIFPTPNSDNLVICVTGTGEDKGFTSLITGTIPNIHMVAGGQCFPLYLYEIDKDGNTESAQGTLSLSTGSSESGLVKKDSISEAGYEHFKSAYPREHFTKEDIFFYIYGLLHSQEYRARYADNLSKELPRIPCVKKAEDFWAFVQAGRDLADLHLNYESVDCYKVKLEKGTKKLTDDQYRVIKMKFAKQRVDGKSVNDKSTVIYNSHIKITDIPLEAYEYVVNGKPALEWVMERQIVKTDKASQIVNDANLWATETMGDAKYPLELFLRVITVSLETMKIVKSLPVLDI